MRIAPRAGLFFVPKKRPLRAGGPGGAYAVRTEEKGKRAYVFTSAEGLREEVVHAGDKQRTIGIYGFEGAFRLVA